MVYAALAPLVLLLPAAPVHAADAAQYKVGMAVRHFTPSGPFDWRGAREHDLKVTLWYPAQASAKEIAIETPTAEPIWQAGLAAPDAPAARGRFPLVVLSHGTGSAGVQLAWLATTLARHGFIAAAVNHPGNSYEDNTTFEGFLLRWQRARDLSATIDAILADKDLGPLVDGKRIGAAGFSLGAYTVLEIAGARTDMEGLYRFCESHRGSCVPPPGYPDLLGQTDAKARTDPGFRAALAHAGDSYRDERVRAVFAISPPLAHSLAPSSLAAIAIPVRLVVGDNDRAAPANDNAAYLAKSIKGARLDILTGGIGHYVFLDLPTARGRVSRPDYAVDPAGVDRAAIHVRVADMATTFFSETLR